MLRPKRTKNKNRRQTTDFPTIFYQSIPADKIKTGSAGAPRPSSAPADLKKRQILMWSGVIIIMIFLIGLWGMTLKERISTANQNAVNSDFSFLKSKNELSEIFRENNQLGGMIKQALASFQASSTLSTNQVEELKKKIENRN